MKDVVLLHGLDARLHDFLLGILLGTILAVFLNEGLYAGSRAKPLMLQPVVGAQVWPIFCSLLILAQPRSQGDHREPGIWRAKPDALGPMTAQQSAKAVLQRILKPAAIYKGWLATTPSRAGRISARNEDAADSVVNTRRLYGKQHRAKSSESDFECPNQTINMGHRRNLPAGPRQLPTRIMRS